LICLASLRHLQEANLLFASIVKLLGLLKGPLVGNLNRRLAGVLCTNVGFNHKLLVLGLIPDNALPLSALEVVVRQVAHQDRSELTDAWTLSLANSYFGIHK